MKIGDMVVAVGYQHLTEEERKKAGWPNFLLRGRHRINKTKATEFGLLVKTDRQAEWLNSGWFKLTE